MYGTGPESVSQLMTIPHLIKKNGFIPACFKKDGHETEFRHLVVGQLFRMLSTNIEPFEKHLIMRKIGPSSVERNATVVTTLSPYHNPIGQVWKIDPRAPVVLATL